jgi:signal peptidase I
MNTLIILVALIIILIFLLQALILYKTTKLFKVKKSNYKISLFVLLLIAISILITKLITSIINIEIITIILELIIPFGTFFLALKQYYKIKINKIIWIYISFLILSSIIFGTITALTRTFIITPYILQGNSMSPTLQNGEYMLFKKFDKNYKRNEIIAFKNKENQIIISRIIALPKEKIQIKNGLILINGKILKTQKIPGDIDVTLSKKEYFVLSDNRINSIGDSRTYGPINANDIIATYLTSYSKFHINVQNNE